MMYVILMIVACMILAPEATGLRLPSLANLQQRHQSFKALNQQSIVAESGAPEEQEANLLQAFFNTKQSSFEKDGLIDGLAFLSGWVDAVTFLHYKAYATMLTGTAINLMGALVHQRMKDAFFFVLICVGYVGGVCLHRGHEAKRGRPETTKMVAPAVLALFVSTDVLTHYFNGARWPIINIATAFGIINIQSGISTGAITCMLTGHIQRITAYVSEVVTGGAAGLKGAPKEALVTSTKILLYFCAGVAGCTAAVRYVPMSIQLKVPRFSVLGAAYFLLLRRMK